MKKLILTVITIILFIPSLVFASTNYVQDDAKLYTEKEIATIQKELDEFSNKNNFDIVLVTTNNTNGKTSMAYADDYFDYNGYKEDGALMLINMQKREIWISTTGLGISYFNDAKLNSILDVVTPKLSSKNYKGAYDSFFKEISSVVSLYTWEEEKVNINDLIYGDTSILTENEIMELQNSIKQIKNDYGKDMIILIKPETNTLTNDIYTDLFLKNNDFQENILVYTLSLRSRTGGFYTKGNLNTIIDSKQITEIINAGKDNLTNNEHYKTLTNILAKTNHFLLKEIKGLSLSYRFMYVLPNFLSYLLGSFCIASIITLIGVAMTNTKKKASTKNYAAKEGIQFSNKTDLMIHTHTSKTYIPPSDSSSGSGGGTSTHTGSSGTSHGGAGRSF